MSRFIAVAMVCALKNKTPLTAKQLAIETHTEESNAREWLYEFEAQGLVMRELRTQRGKSSGRSTIFWHWQKDQPPQSWCPT